MANTAPFPITIGPDQMVIGRLLVSARPDAPGLEPLTGYLPIPFDLVPVLNPGQHLAVDETLDAGPLADLALTMAQRHLEVEFKVALDPVQSADGHWTSRLGPNLVASAKLVRQGVQYTPNGLAEITGNFRDDNPARRLHGLRTAAGLLAERLQAMRQALDYGPARIDKTKLEALLRTGLRDPDPIVRARTPDCLGLLPFKDEHAPLIAPLLSDSHWLVRLTAVDFLAIRQGVVFSPVAEALAERDPDLLVRQLARLHTHRLQAQQRSPTGEP
jgi:hypothetical protein